MKSDSTAPLRLRQLHPYLGKLIKKLRLKYKLSQQELADKSEVSRSTISRLESGRHRNIGMEHLERIANQLGMSLMTCIAMTVQMAQSMM